MSVLHKLGIVGIRSYSPDQLETIEFHPLTLIWGENGSGKTTIIQCLKFVTTGTTPPGTLGGKNFVLDPKLVSKPEVIGEVKLNFSDYTGKKFVTSRKVLVSYVKKKGEPKMEFRTIQQNLKTRDQTSQELISINHHCADIDRQIPALFGVSKSVLENVIFCQQDQALWPFGDNTTLKGIFDELFQTKDYARVYEAMKENHKKIQKQLKEMTIYLEAKRQTFLRTLRNKKKGLLEYEQLQRMCSRLPHMVDKLAEYEQKKKLYQDKEKELKVAIMGSGTCEGKKVNLLKQLSIYGLNQIQSLSHNASPQKNQNCKQLFHKLEEEYQPLVLEVEQLQKQYSLIKALEEQKQQGKLLTIQVQNIRQRFTFIQDSNPSHVISRLKQLKQKQVEAAQKLKGFRNQLENMHFPKLDQPEEGRLQSQKVKERLQNQRVRELQGTFSYIYQKLYDLSVSQMKKVQYSYEYHEQLKARLKVSQEKLERLAYERSNLQKKLEAARKRVNIQQLKYSGITMQEEMMKFAASKKKCVFCSKQLSEEQLDHVQSKCQERIQKARGQIEVLQECSGDSEAGVTYGSLEDIEVEERKLRRQMHTLQSEIEASEQLRQVHGRYMKCRQQLQLNAKLDSVIRQYPQVSIKRVMEYQPEIQRCDYEAFYMCVRDFVEENKLLSSLRTGIRKLEQEQADYQHKVSQTQSFRKRKSEVNQHIGALEATVKQLSVVDDYLQRLERLTKLRQAAGKSPSRSQTNPLSIYDKLNETSKLKTENEARRSQLQAQIKLNELIIQFKETSKDLSMLQSRKKDLSQAIQIGRQQDQKYQKLRMEISNLKAIVETRMSGIHQEEDKTRQYQRLVMQQRVKRQQQRELSNSMKALELSLTQFHAEKLDEINRILRQIWQTIYTGGDIQYVRIRSADEDGNPTQNKKKPYSYALMMCVEGTEIEMKGRCSMGQKVLASIVIRLALAQCFAMKCNIMALDEPTANLDSNHVRSLAESLSRLIQRRRQDEGFQLIIITHDMQFVGMLTKFIPHYYKVEKVDGWSKITVRETM